MEPFLAHLGLAFAVLILVAIFLKIALRLLVRGAGQMILKKLGDRALAKQPDTLELHRDAGAPWRDPARMEALSRPLLNAGFADCGIYVTDKMPGIRIWFLLNEQSRTAAFLYDHNRGNMWCELSVRYDDGTTTACSNLPPTGINLNPPFYRRIVVDPATPTDEMYRRIMSERSAFGIKEITPQNVVPEFETAYAKIMVWQKNKGLSVEEVAAVVKKWQEKKQAATCGRP
jgi:hypothetical protein